jgi:hypothetical protein
MEKLSLNLDDLKVDTFKTDSSSKDKGTVFGQTDNICPSDYCQDTDPSCFYDQCTHPVRCGPVME